MKIADSRIRPTFELEAAEHQLGSRPIAGVDEAGRGPWAGPVVAAAVILDPDKIPANIDDSKALDEESRAYLYRRIMKVAIVGVGIADVDRIDRENILGATLWAMAQAVSQLSETPKLILVDGDKTPRVPMTARAIVKGDSKCLSIAAASIIAKVTRDRMMMEFARHYPGYGFERHKGYGTPEHQAAIKKLGVTALHRRSFRPVQLALGLVDEVTPRRRRQLGFGLQIESKI
ncbi:ribonuclease HII [Hyphomicrobium sp.]|jgi:ribonuclease HII|uniref:ribonuclease HII n=1 Tax=Hyphomicrobium sp. TaxID=82 RepID=UPI002CC8ACD1|nr:ribonuclease HII [Hyphomicrobium sp.]HVZ06154.1 ribonuclease HII [Hyphomicrobium sp.]